MALLALSLVLATVVWALFRWPPPLMETLLAIWRGHPRIEQSSASGTTAGPVDEPGDAPTIREPSTATEHRRAGVSLPTIAVPNVNTEETSPQTTPKAKASSHPSSVPTLSLSASPPASAAALARTNESAAPQSPPTLSGPQPAAPSALMPPPPPRLPKLNNITKPSSVSTLSPAPNRLATSARQPGTSTLAPPPTHASKPAKPSRKVILTPGHSPLDWARLANGPTSDLRNLAPGTPYLKITPSQLRVQTGRKGKDAWTALGGRVYNITPYLPFHPGGEPELLRVAGRDGTKLFGEIHPWVNYEGMLASSMIGMLVEEGEAAGNGVMDEMD